MRLSRSFFFIFLLMLASPALAGGIFNINYIDPNNLSGAIPQNLANEAIKMFGIYSAHRPYSGATSLGHVNSLDFLIEASLVKLGPGLIDALKADGIAGAPIAVPAVPMAKIQIRKALGERADFGISGLYYRGQSVIGGDLKIVLQDAEEGVSIALRFGLTYAEVPYAYIKNCTTYSPELLISQRMSFAEPYLGIGGRYVTGTVLVPFKGSPPFFPDFSVEKSGHGATGYAFTGVYFRILGAQGLRLGIEGSYDLSGFDTMGAVVGLGF
jgi:hypothetical protein